MIKEAIAGALLLATGMICGMSIERRHAQEMLTLRTAALPITFTGYNVPVPMTGTGSAFVGQSYGSGVYIDETYGNTYGDGYLDGTYESGYVAVDDGSDKPNEDQFGDECEAGSVAPT